MAHGPLARHPDLVKDWKEHAACAGYPNSVFFPGPEASGPEVERAQAICAQCPVAQECLMYAFETNQRSGVWGGKTEEQRKSLRRKWLAERRRSA